MRFAGIILYTTSTVTIDPDRFCMMDLRTRVAQSGLRSEFQAVQWSHKVLPWLLACQQFALLPCPGRWKFIPIAVSDG